MKMVSKTISIYYHEWILTFLLQLLLQWAMMVSIVNKHEIQKSKRRVKIKQLFVQIEKK